jgi:hypothetical protein
VVGVRGWGLRICGADGSGSAAVVVDGRSGLLVDWGHASVRVYWRSGLRVYGGHATVAVVVLGIVSIVVRWRSRAGAGSWTPAWKGSRGIGIVLVRV